MKETRYQCPCCEYWTLSGDPHRYQICPVCFWEDDPLQFDDPKMDFGANGISLDEARVIFTKIGASSEEYSSLVRAPYPHETKRNE
jgi:hypothetical protein